MKKKQKQFGWFRQQESGFTLIELLVVLSIIAFIASSGLFATASASVKARDARRKADIAQLQKALELYYNTNGAYPISGATPQNWSASNDSTALAALQTKMSGVMSKLPQDPNVTTAGNVLSDPNVYAYAYWSGDWGGCYAGTYYILVYKLERLDITSPGGTWCDGSPLLYSPPYTPATNNITHVMKAFR